jgi:antitoxin VapB
MREAMDTAKVFMTGRSQAVRLPKAYRFDTDEVTIERTPDGAVLLRPKPKRPGDLGERIRRILEEAGDTSDFVRPEQPPIERDAAWWDAHGFAPPAPAPTRKRRARG